MTTITSSKEKQMTLGEKIREARRQAGLSQEQLAEKLNVSRSAVAKWETDKGLPDIDNLRYLSKLLSVSVDHLIDDGEDFESLVMREPYSLADYGKGLKKTRKDRVIRKRFPDAKIHTLLAKRVLTRSEHIWQDVFGLIFGFFGLADFFASIRELEFEPYLVEEEGRQFLVTVTDEFIEIRRLTRPVTDKKFILGEKKYILCPFHEPKK